MINPCFNPLCEACFKRRPHSDEEREKFHPQQGKDFIEGEGRKSNVNQPPEKEQECQANAK